jgi:hypothetical protein
MKKPFIVHPLLFALFPTVFLYSRNMSEYPPAVMVIPAAVCLLLALMLWLVFGLIFRSIGKGALITSLFLLLFFSYGQLYDLLWYFFSVRPFTLREGANFVLKPLFALLFLGGGFLLLRTRHEPAGLTRWANAVTVILIAVPLTTMFFAFLAGGSRPTAADGIPVEQPAAEKRDTQAQLPDIYYIILDGFAREDVLADLYEYPDSRLYNYLRQRGFYIGGRSGSNYCQTTLSLSSSLNYKYLDADEDGYYANAKDTQALDRILLNSRVVRFLRERGYTTMAFATGSPATEMRDADVFLEPASKVGFLDEFQSGLINSTALPFLIPSTKPVPFWGERLSHLQAEARRELILRTADLLAEMPQRVSPKFVFAHLVAPHPPFIFGPNGEPRDPPIAWSLADGNWLIGRLNTRQDGYIMLYRDQLQFIEKIIVTAIESILAASSQPPIIVLQSDHGPGAYLDWNSSERTNMRERLSILNAYYLPHGGDSLLYDTITPVNTFRVILNRYFDQNLELLPDASYYSMWEKPFWFIPVSQAVQGDTIVPGSVLSD